MSRGNLWTPQENAIVRVNYPTSGSRYTKRVLEDAGFFRSTMAIVWQAKMLGVKREKYVRPAKTTVVEIVPDETIAAIEASRNGDYSKLEGLAHATKPGRAKETGGREAAQATVGGGRQGGDAGAVSDPGRRGRSQVDDGQPSPAPLVRDDQEVCQQAPDTLCSEPEPELEYDCWEPAANLDADERQRDLLRWQVSAAMKANTGNAGEEGQ